LEVIRIQYGLQIRTNLALAEVCALRVLLFNIRVAFLCHHIHELPTLIWSVFAHLTHNNFIAIHAKTQLVHTNQKLFISQDFQFVSQTPETARTPFLSESASSYEPIRLFRPLYLFHCLRTCAPAHFAAV